MNYQTHRLGGTCAGIVLGLYLTQASPLPTSIIPFSCIVLGSTLGSALPDIDEPNSHAGRKIKPISSVIKYTTGHRGMFHSPIFWGMIFGLIYWLMNHYSVSGIITNSLFAGVMLGVASHLMLDMLTVSGIPLFYPITKKKFHLLKLQTGKHETFVRALCIICCVIGISLIIKDSVVI